jgi:hypothetical protein
MNENLEKFLKVDKYKTEVSETLAKKEASPNDTTLVKAYNTAKEKLDKATPN